MMKRLVMTGLLVGACLLPARAQEAGQQTFANPQDAVQALVAVASNQDAKGFEGLVGSSARALLNSGNSAEDKASREAFIQALKQNVQLVPLDDALVMLTIGPDNFPVPVPLVKKADRWYFDGQLGLQEVQARRIGHNELSVIRACEAYLRAQREYAQLDPEGSGIYQFAQRFVSQPGKHDGLYWKATQGGQTSPLGPFFAEPAHQGAQAGQPFCGYHFRILTGQGKDAPGGLHSYVINDHMVAGFGLIAYPAVYGKTGVMTFIMGPAGVVYQQDLKDHTEELGRTTQEFNPGPGWKKI